MAKNTQQTKQKPTIDDDGLDHEPVYTFEPFNYAPEHLEGEAMDEIPSYAVCDLVNHTIDVAQGAALIFRIIEDHQTEMEERCPMPYLNEHQKEILMRFAGRSVEGLAKSAIDFADLLRKIDRSHKSNGVEVKP